MSYNSKEITLPSGATAVIKDERLLLVKERNFVLECADHPTPVKQAIGMTNGLIAVMVDSWSFDLLPPMISLQSLEKLTPADYEALKIAALPAELALFPNLEDAKEAENPKATTANSNG